MRQKILIKVFTWIPLILCTFLLLNGCDEDKAEIVLKGDRLLGIEVNTAEDQEFEEAFALAQSAGIDFNHVSFQWSIYETAPQTYEDINYYLEIVNLFYPQENTPILSTVLGPVNTTVRDMPLDLLGLSFNDTDVVSRYCSFVSWLLEAIAETDNLGLVLGNEVDIYLDSNPEEWSTYIDFLSQVIENLKSDYPDLPMGTAVTLYGLIEDANQNMDALLAVCDFVSITYYPLHEDFTVKDPGVVQEDFNQLISKVSIPIYFQEAGYPTSEDCLSSEDKQSQFVEQVFRQWDRYPEPIKGISFYMLTDWDPLDLNAYIDYLGIENNPALQGYLGTLGFRTYPGTGANKKSFATIKAMTANRQW